MKIMSAAEAVAGIADGAVVSISGGGYRVAPEALLAALEQRFVDTGAPRDLTAIAVGVGPGVGVPTVGPVPFGAGVGRRVTRAWESVSASARGRRAAGAAGNRRRSRRWAEMPTDVVGGARRHDEAHVASVCTEPGWDHHRRGSAG